MTLFFEKLNELLASERPFVLVTVVDTIGSVPQDVGSKMLVTEEGIFFGTVGGGKVEARAIVEAKAMLEPSARLSDMKPNRHAPHNTRFWNWSLNKDIGMTCGGSVKMFMEAYYCKPWRITVFGAGHISNAVMNLLINLECQITCYDTRQEWLNKLPESKRLVKRCSENLVSEVANIREGDFLLLMTMGHSSDMPVLIEILRSRAAHTTPYIGVIGSDAKAARLRKDVLEAGLGDADTRRFSCPMGLPFGTNDPNEIAVSISAQLLQVRDQLRVKANAERAAGNGGAAQVSETRSGVTTSIEEEISCGAQPSQEAKIEATIEAKTVRESATSGRDLSQPLRND